MKMMKKNHPVNFYFTILITKLNSSMHSLYLDQWMVLKLFLKNIMKILITVNFLNTFAQCFVKLKKKIINKIYK